MVGAGIDRGRTAQRLIEAGDDEDDQSMNMARNRQDEVNAAESWEWSHCGQKRSDQNDRPHDSRQTTTNGVQSLAPQAGHVIVLMERFRMKHLLPNRSRLKLHELLLKCAQAAGGGVE
jgi:hypothetical protein